ncbi:MAG: tRNA (adenosine(37)-N6)-threonylcarbamoyltransferase complex ATPase subunit type 1 TsaE [Patescibacteria group bacterium]
MHKTNSFKQTQKLAKTMAKKISTAKIKRKNALVFAFEGDLGSGKTTFAQGFLKGLGLKKKVISPTFVIIKNYKIKKSGSFSNIYHIDLYRIKKAKEALDLGLKQILKNPKNIILIEWPQIIKRYLPKNAIRIKFNHGEKENKRIIVFNKIDFHRL